MPTHVHPHATPPPHPPRHPPAATWMLEVTGGSTSTTFKASDQDFPTLYKVGGCGWVGELVVGGWVGWQWVGGCGLKGGVG